MVLAKIETRDEFENDVQPETEAIHLQCEKTFHRQNMCTTDSTPDLLVNRKLTPGPDEAF